MSSVSDPAGMDDYAIGVLPGQLLVELSALWLSVDGRPVNSLFEVLLAHNFVFLSPELTWDRLAQVSPDFMHVDLAAAQLVVRTGPVLNTLRLHVTSEEVEGELGGRGELVTVLIGEDFGLRSALALGEPIPERRLAEAAAGRRLLVGSVEIR